MHTRPDHDDLIAMMIAQESDATAGEPRSLVQWGEPLQFDLRRDGNVMGRFARHVASSGVVLLEGTLPGPSQVDFGEGQLLEKCRFCGDYLRVKPPCPEFIVSSS
jgi:hypothetical protein